MKPAIFLIFLLLFALSFSLYADSGYTLIYEEDGVEHRIVGVEDFKPYYEADGGKRFLTMAGEMKLLKSVSSDSLSVHYPISYCLENIGKPADRASDVTLYRAFLRLNSFKAGWKYMSIKDLKYLWPEETLENGLLVFAWVVNGHIVTFDFTAYSRTNKSIKLERTLGINLDESDISGHPILLLFKDGKTVPPVQLAKGPALNAYFHATKTGDVKLLKETLAADSNLVRKKDNLGNSALHYAAGFGHIDIVDILLEAGESANVRDTNGNTPLTLACSNDRQAVMNKLLQAGANIKALNRRNYSAIDYGIRFGHSDAVAAILEYRDKNYISAPILNGTVSLAMRHNRGEIVRMLDAANANWSPGKAYLNRSLVRKTPTGDPEIIKYLLSRNTDPDTRRAGLTPLIIASRNGDADLVKLLVEAGAKADLAGPDGLTPLMAAASSGSSDVVEFLINAGADVNRKSNDRFTPLHFASSQINDDVVKLLIEAGANPNAENKNGTTPLQAATGRGSRKIVEDLLMAGAECRLDTVERAMPFMEYAFRYNMPEVVEIALQQCLTADFKFYGRFPALWVAQYYNNEEIVAVLKRYGAVLNRGYTPNIVPEEKLEQSLEVRKWIDFEYTQVLQDRYGTQELLISFLVDEEGKVLFPRIDSGKFEYLNYIVIKALTQWEFTPAVSGGKPVLTHARLPIILEKRDPHEVVLQVKDEELIPEYYTRYRPLGSPVIIRIGRPSSYTMRISAEGRIEFLYDR